MNDLKVFFYGDQNEIGNRPGLENEDEQIAPEDDAQSETSFALVVERLRQELKDVGDDEEDGGGEVDEDLVDDEEGDLLFAHVWHQKDAKNETVEYDSDHSNRYYETLENKRYAIASTNDDTTLRGRIRGGGEGRAFRGVCGGFIRRQR